MSGKSCIVQQCICFLGVELQRLLFIISPLSTVYSALYNAQRLHHSPCSANVIIQPTGAVQRNDLGMFILLLFFVVIFHLPSIPSHPKHTPFSFIRFPPPHVMLLERTSHWVMVSKRKPGTTKAMWKKSWDGAGGILKQVEIAGTQ